MPRASLRETSILTESDTHSDHEYENVLLTLENTYIKPWFERDPYSFQLLSTIRYDPSLTETPPLSPGDITSGNFFLLDLHVLRLKYTLEYFYLQFEIVKMLELDGEFMLGKLREAVEESGKDILESYKLRLLVRLDGEVTIEVHDTPRIKDLTAAINGHAEPTFDLYIAKLPTPISPYTSFKTTVRSHYTEARENTLPGKRIGKEEVILYSFQGILTEGSITNVAVRHGDKWVTPMLSSGCLCGVMRHHLLKLGLIEELTTNIHSITPGTELLIFNAIFGVAKGILMK